MDPISAWRARQTSVVDDPPEESLESVDDLEGTVFDNSDPIARWKREAIPKTDPLGVIGHGIKSTMEFATRPVRAIAEPLEANADYLTRSIPENENSVRTASPLSLMKAFGAGINKTIGSMASPVGAASFVPGPIGVGARAMLAGQQVPEGIEQTAEGVREGDWQKTAGGAANTALGASLVGGDIWRGLHTAEPPMSGEHAFRGFEAADRARKAEADFLRRSQPDRALTEGADYRDAEQAGYDPYPHRELEQHLLGPGSDPNAPIDGDFYEPQPPQLPPGSPPRFAAGERGTVDIPKDYANDPIAAWREAAGLDRPPVGLLPPRAGDAGIGLPGRPGMSPEEFLGSANLREGAPLSELEAQLYPETPRGPEGTQLGLNGLADLTAQIPPTVAPEGPNVAVPQPDTVPPGRPSIADRMEGPAKGRELSPEQLQGIDELDGFLDALYGDPEPRGNGTYRDEEAVSPATPDAAAPGPLPAGGPGERALPDGGGLVPTGSAERGAAGRRPARAATADESLVTDLIDQAVQDGYQGDPQALRSYLDDRIQLVKEIDDEFDNSGRKPENLLRAIAGYGGISSDAESGLKGELAWLKESLDNYGTALRPRTAFGTVKGIKGVLNGKRGLSVDGMLEALRQDPKFNHIESINDLLEELQAAMSADADTGLAGKLKRAGVEYGGKWWNDLEGAPGSDDFDPRAIDNDEWSRLANTNPTSGNMTINPGEVGMRPTELSYEELERQFDPKPDPVAVDTLDTGEEQPRLPEAGKVRDANIQTPEFDAPFSLNAEADRTPRALEQALGFDADPNVDAVPGGRAGTSLDDLEQLLTRHDVRNPGKAEEIGQSMSRVGWKGRPILVLNDGGRRTAWTGTHRLEGAKRAGLKPADVPMVEIDADALRAAGYDVDELTSLSKKKRIAALRAAGLDDAASLLEDERAAAQSRRSADPDVDVPEDLAPNVRDYLTRQLGYTADEVSAMGPDEARRIGQEQVAHPERAARRAPAPPAAVENLPERSTLPGLRNFDELRGARGQQRVAKLHRSAVAPSEPGAVEGAPAPKTPADRQAAGEALTTKERQALNLPEPEKSRGRTSSRELGSSPRQIEQRVRRMDSWMEDPTPQNFRRWVDEVTGQAERVNERQLKGGTGEEGKMPGKSDSGEVLAGSPFPGFQVLADPRILKRVGQFLISDEGTDRLLRGVIGAGVGAWTEDDNRLRGAIYGAVAGMMGPEIARAWSSDFVALAKGQIPKAPAGLPRVYEPRGKGDIGVFENVAGSKAHTIPEQFAAVRPAVDALQDIRETGKLDSRLPLLTNDRMGDAGSPAYAGGKLQVRQSQFLKPEIGYLRSEAKKAAGKGKPRMASYLNAYADELAGVMTRSETFLRDSGVPSKLMNRIAGEGANQVYRQGLALNVGSAAVNRISQPLLTAPYVGLRNLWKNYTPLSESEKGLSDIKQPVDKADMPRAGWKFLQKFDEIASSLMRFTDNHNRQGAYAAAHLAAEQAGAPPRAGHAFARDVSEKTQGLYGLLSGNPRWRGPVIKTLKPFTKYPILFTEWLNDAATSADPRVRWRTAAMGAGVWAFSQATGVDLFDLVSGGARYGGSGMLRGAMDLYAHATNQAKDHKVFETPGKGFLDSDVGNVMYPVGVRKVVDTARRFKTSGFGPHKTRTPGGALETVSPTEDLLNMFGVRTTRQTARQGMLNESHAHELAAAETDSQENAQSKRDLLKALDADDLEAAQTALARMGPNTRRSVLKAQNRDRYERLLHATPRKRRQDLRDNYGELEHELQGPHP